METFMAVEVPMAGIPAGVVTDELGRPVAPFDLLVPYPKNPRRPEDFDPRLSVPFKDLVDSIDENGVREPINVFELDGMLQMLSGHRRLAAVRIVNRRREDVYKAKVNLGELKEGESRPPKLEPITGLPISMVAPPRNEFERQADMWVAESQRQKWPVDKLVPFFKETWESGATDVRSDTRYLARRLGLPYQRVKLLTTIVTSPVLYRAAIDPTNDLLELQGREKTLRSVVRVADIVHQYRPEVTIRVTGMDPDDDGALERLRELVLAKASEYAKERNIPAGVSLERTAPTLKDPDVHSDNELVAWLTGPGVIAEERLPTTVKSRRSGDDDEEVDGDGAQSLRATLRHYEAVELAKLDASALNNLVNELLEASDVLDRLVVEAKTARRNRV